MGGLNFRIVCFRREQELTQVAILKTKKERQEQLRTTSWWLPQFQPEAVKEVIKQVGRRLLSCAWYAVTFYLSTKLPKLLPFPKKNCFLFDLILSSWLPFASTVCISSTEDTQIFWIACSGDACLLV